MRQRAGTDVFAQEKEGGGGPGKIELDLKKKAANSFLLYWGLWCTCKCL